MYKRDASSSAQDIRRIISTRTLDKLRTVIDLPSGIVFKSEVEFIKFLLTLCPEQDREKYVESIDVLRRVNAILLLRIGGDFTDPLVTELREFIKQKEVE